MSTRLRSARPRGFSLLEVMVALAIFGLMISGILAAQAGLAASNKKAANMGQAVNLARCRMTEAEEKLLKFGYPELDDIDDGAPCCDGIQSSTFTCDTKVEKIILPDPPVSTFGEDGGASSLINAFGPDAGAGPAGNATLNFNGGIGSLGSAISQQTGGQGAAGLVNMAMGMVYPTMKPMMESSIRKVTVTVHWKEGPNPQTFDLVQYVTNPQRGGFISGVPSAGGANGAAGATGNPGGSTGTRTSGPAAGGMNGFGGPR